MIDLWRRIRWSLYAPVYDLLVRFDGPRSRSIARLELTAGQRVLVVGAGTGADLRFLPDGVFALVTDISPAMLARARAHGRPEFEFRIADARSLDVRDGAFDAAILHLVLAVVPEPDRALREAARAVRPGGRIAVFDKFVAEGDGPGLLRRAANPLARLLATDLNRRLSGIVGSSGAPLEILFDEPAALAGLFRTAQLRRVR